MSEQRFEKENATENGKNAEQVKPNRASSDGMITRRDMIKTLSLTGALVASSGLFHTFRSEANGASPHDKIGDLSELETTEKSNVVGAVNENVARLEEHTNEMGDPTQIDTGENSIYSNLAVMRYFVNIKESRFSKLVTNNDWTQAIQAALTYLVALGKGTLYFPSGVYYVSRKTSTAKFCIDLRSAQNIEIKGEAGATITADVDVSERDINVFLLRNVENISITGLTWDIKVHGEPSTRTNSRILWVSATDYEQATFQNIWITNNKFKMKHATGASAVKALYGVLITGGLTNKGTNAWLINNHFDDMDGRNLELVTVEAIKVHGNIFDNVGRDYNGVGIRVLAGAKDISVIGNTLKSVHDGEGAVDLIQLSYGKDNIITENIKVIGNTLIVQNDNNAQRGIKIQGVKNVRISDNHMETSYATNESVKATTGIIMVSGVRNENIWINGNYFTGFTNYSIAVQDAELLNSYVSYNHFGRTYFNISGRDISDGNNRLSLVENNWFALRNQIAQGKQRMIEMYGESPPTGTDYYYNPGDKVINITPTPGSYAGWICVDAGAPGTWKGYGLIET